MGNDYQVLDFEQPVLNSWIFVSVLISNISHKRIIEGIFMLKLVSAENFMLVGQRIFNILLFLRL